MRWSLCREELKTNKKQGHDGREVTALARRVTATLETAFGGEVGDGGGVGGGGGECNNQAKEVISFDRVKCYTCLDYAAVTQ